MGGIGGFCMTAVGPGGGRGVVAVISGLIDLMCDNRYNRLGSG